MPIDEIQALTKLERQQLVQLNQRLQKIEEDITREADEIYFNSRHRKKISEDWTSDFKFEIKFTFYLDESHPNYYEDADDENSLVTDLTQQGTKIA